jgi:hypothetical protein
MRAKGISHDTGSSCGVTRRPFDHAIVRRELEIIRDDLRRPAVRLFGDDLDRLEFCASYAAGLGLKVWFSPFTHQFDPKQMLDLLADGADRAAGRGARSDQRLPRRGRPRAVRRQGHLRLDSVRGVDWTPFDIQALRAGALEVGVGSPVSARGEGRVEVVVAVHDQGGLGHGVEGQRPHRGRLRLRGRREVGTVAGGCHGNAGLDPVVGEIQRSIHRIGYALAEEHGCGGAAHRVPDDGEINMFRTQRAPAGEIRSTYHHGALREFLIRACVALSESEGIGTVSLRRVAREAGRKPWASCRHFADRAELLTTITAHGFEQLVTEMRAAHDSAGTRWKP